MQENFEGGSKKNSKPEINDSTPNFNDDDYDDIDDVTIPNNNDDAEKMQKILSKKKSKQIVPEDSKVIDLTQ